MSRIRFNIEPARAEAYRRNGWWRGQTLKDLLDRAVERDPKKVAVQWKGGALTYAELQIRAQTFAHGLRDLGVRPGDVIAVQLQNTAEFITCYLGAGLCGAVLQTVHTPYRQDELVTLLRHSRAKIFVGHDRIKDYEPAKVMIGLRSQLPDLITVVCVGDELPEGATAFGALLAGPGRGAVYEPRPTDPYVLLYTSGTTASPKGVVSIYETYIGNAHQCVTVLDLDADSIVLSAAPFTHLYGIFTLNVSLCAGATIALLPAFTPADLIEACVTFRPTALFCGPAHLSASLQAGILEGGSLSSLSFVMISGAFCPAALAEKVQQLLPAGEVMQLWGMSELQCGSIVRRGDPLEVRTSSVGRPCPGNQIRVAIPAGVEPGSAVEGEVQISGASVFSGYLDNEAANRCAFTEDGWFCTGDIGRLDESGNLHITGRTKEIINRGGVKINPIDIEDLLLRHPSIAQCAIVPIPDPVLGERACCCVVLKPGTALTFIEMIDWLGKRGVAKLKWPERLEVMEELPVTPTRKVMKARLAEAVKERVARERL